MSDRTSLFLNHFELFCFLFGGILGSAKFSSPRAPKWALHLVCYTAAFTTSKKVLFNIKLVKIKMLDLSDHSRAGISILKTAVDLKQGIYDIKKKCTSR